MNDSPLWPADGMVYDLALMAAQKEYDAWVDSRRGGNGNRKGITVYSRKQINKAEAE
jgi:hypothetical protein